MRCESDNGDMIWEHLALENSLLFDDRSLDFPTAHRLSSHGNDDIRRRPLP